MDIIGTIAREGDRQTLKLWKHSDNNLSCLLYHLCFSFVKYVLLILFLFQTRTKEEGKKHQISPKFHCAFRGRCTGGIHVFSPKVCYFFLSHMVISHFWWILSTNFVTGVKTWKEHLLKRGKVMIVHMKPLKGNLYITEISLSSHLALKTSIFDYQDSHSLEVSSKKKRNRTNSNSGRSKLYVL